jgi:UDP-N-acetylmuramate: L-alanyl-gamma-D-glutamyl-meso-diaminopimelate ligase
VIDVGRELRHVHLIGACGTGMASLACLLRQAGYRVSGSDAATYPPMSEVLESQGIALLEGYREENLEPAPDLVIIGNAISRGNPEAEAVLDRGLDYASLPEALAGLFLRGRRVIGVAGTHGKTTTASMIAHLLDRAGRRPSFFLGGQPLGFEAPSRLGKGEDFVVEADEYDSAFFDKEPKFLHYRPRVLVIGSVEFDHADIYPDLEAILLRFRRLLRGVPASGRVILGRDDAGARSLIPEAYTPVETFALEGEAAWRAEVLEAGAAGTEFRLEGPGAAGPWRGSLPQPGEFNLRNGIAAVAAAAAAGLDPEEALRHLGSFPGVKRRLELRAETAGVRVYDDFAHHPTAVKGTLRALRRHDAGRRLVAVLEPRSNTLRRRLMQERLAEALEGADQVLLAGVHRAHLLAEEERLDTEALAEALKRAGTAALALRGAEEILDHLSASLREGDTVVVMSNGGFDGLVPRLVESLDAR